MAAGKPPISKKEITMLTLTIKKKWFDMIASGKKKEEYREIKEYYDARLGNTFGAIWVDGELAQGECVPKEIRKDPVQKIIFRNGYAKNSRKLVAECRLGTGEGKTEWGAEPGKQYYILKIENVERIIKYAIYKGKVGLYAKEYFDRIDKDILKDRGVLGWWGITEDRLPIVVNDCGGRCSFFPVEENFVEIIEIPENQEPLTREQKYPKNSTEFEFGWISPDGDTYNTGFEGHYGAAVMLCKEYGYNEYFPERMLEKKGWIKIMRDAPYTPDNWKKRIYAEGLKITKKQADTLVDLGYSADEEFKMILEISERYW